MGDEDIAAPDGIGCAGMAQGVGLEVAVAGALVEAVSTAGAAQGSWRGCACRDEGRASVSPWFGCVVVRFVCVIRVSRVSRACVLCVSRSELLRHRRFPRWF